MIDAARAAPTAGPLHFNAVLHPHRSLGARGFAILMLAFGMVSLAIGTMFALQGAWPVFGFFGLDALALYVAFRLSYRGARLREVVQVSDSAVVLRRIEPDGRSRDWRFQPYWVQVEETAGRGGMLALRSHGRAVAFGRFLTEEERGELAAAIRQALRRLKEPRASPPA